LAFSLALLFDIHGKSLQAQAEPVTPEATKYQVPESEPDFKAERIKEDAEKSAKLLAEEASR
jgi:hypothetical protein